MKKQKDIVENTVEVFIPYGYENRVSIAYLARVTRLDDRIVRKMIAEAEAPIVNADGGYFKPGRSKRDKEIAHGYVLQEQARAKAIRERLKKFKAYK